MTGALDGLRVLDTRSWRPPEIGELSTYFLCCNRSKKSLAIDIAKPEGAALVRRLAAEADVLREVSDAFR